MFYKTEYRGKHYEISDRMGDSIIMYIENGVLPGSFLRAIICNDLKGAFMEADDENYANLPAFIMYFYWEVPGSICGSHKKMLKWEQANIDKREQERKACYGTHQAR